MRNWKCIPDLWFCCSLRITITLQKQLRKFVVFMAMLLLTMKSESSFQSFILVNYHWEINPNPDTYQPWSRCFKRIGSMQFTQKYSRISSWTQHIPIHNLLPFKKKYWKIELTGCLGSLYSKNMDDCIYIITSLSRQRNYLFL